MPRTGTRPRGTTAWRAIVFGIIGLAGAAGADDGAIAVSGSLRADYFSSSRRLDDERNVFAVYGEMKLTQTLDEHQRIELELRTGLEDAGGENRLRTRWANGHWFVGTDRIDWRIGVQRIRWGKADGINPTDFFTPIDYTVLLPLEADRYLSVPALRADVSLDDTHSVSFVVEPDFTRSRLPPIPVTLIDDEPSGSDDLQYGLRLLHAGESIDWSLSAFNGFSTLPVLSFDSLTAGGMPRYLRYYPRSRGLGFDMAYNVGQWGFRSEIAYTDFGVDGARQSVADNYFLVSGVDRTIDDWNVNLQILLRYVPDYKKTTAFSGPAQQLASLQNAIVHNQQERLTRGMTLRVGVNAWHETLQSEVQAIVFFEPRNYFIRPLISYALSDNVKIRFGGEYYAGPPLSYFGALESNRTLFADVQQFF